MTTDKAMELLPCPFCGGECDPEGWLGGDGTRGPECDNCGATAYTLADWNRRAHIEAMQRDCRTCRSIIQFGDVNGGPVCIRSDCTNHNQWTPAPFKQLTRSQQ